MVIGGSAGAIEALKRIASRLPASLDAAVFVVLHVNHAGGTRLPELLQLAGRLPVRHAAHGERIERGTILIAPPDQHLLLREDRVELSHGPRENSHRPAIDPLFRSAAEVFGDRICGVVLSGYLDDGSDGLSAIAAAGGAAIVQQPDDAAYPDMPGNALSAVPTAEALPSGAIGRRLIDLTGGNIRMARGPEPVIGDDQPGVPTGLTCPDCHGVLWTDGDPDGNGVRCRTGHRFGLGTLAERQRESVEGAMWAAVRALDEEANLARRLAAQSRSQGRPRSARRYLERERTAERHARVLENLLMESVQPEAESAEQELAT